ncbi:MAG: SDR family oxidoreductase [Alistipes sp.]|nr:SDR family oxidoreductase [Alistipes sp.]
MKIKGKIVLITGGASGIGRIMGRRSLQKGAEALIIWDINESNIAATIDELKAYGKVVAERIDITDREAIAAGYAKTKQEFGRVDLLINSAGIVISNNYFEQLNSEEIHRTMAINALAPMEVALAIMPDMIARNEGHICNIASAAGLLANPRMSAYAASKWAVIGWSDSLRVELKERKSRVHVTTIAPYYINTGMFDGVRSRWFMPILDPENTSRKILRAIERNHTFCGIPWGFHIVRLLQGIFPTPIFDFLFGQLFGVYHTMDHFTGRKN